MFVFSTGTNVTSNRLLFNNGISRCSDFVFLLEVRNKRLNNEAFV